MPSIKGPDLPELPNGLHDASVLSVHIDFARQEAQFEIEAWIGDLEAEDEQGREARRWGCLTITGMLFCAMEPPDPKYPFDEAGPLWVADVDPADDPSGLAQRLPPDAFLLSLFVEDWNSFIRVAGREARWEWTQ